jgi:hypothetical protein
MWMLKEGVLKMALIERGLLMRLGHGVWCTFHSPLFGCACGLASLSWQHPPHLSCSLGPCEVPLWQVGWLWTTLSGCGDGQGCSTSVWNRLTQNSRHFTIPCCN